MREDKHHCKVGHKWRCLCSSCYNSERHVPDASADRQKRDYGLFSLDISRVQYICSSSCKARSYLAFRDEVYGPGRDIFDHTWARARQLQGRPNPRCLMLKR